MIFWKSLPRALPWAAMFGPFRAERFQTAEVLPDFKFLNRGSIDGVRLPGNDDTELCIMISPALRHDIEAAFADVSYPGDDRLTVYDAAGREYDETYQLLLGKTWWEFPVIEFMHGDTPIPDLSPEAFHYYMPALLISSLDDNLDVDVTGSLAFSLSPASAKQTEGRFSYDHTEEFMSRMALFTAEQRNVMIQVLREFVTHGWEVDEDVRETIDFLQRLSTGSTS